MAVSDRDLRMAQLLLEYGERVDVENGQGLTTVQVAEEMRAILLEPEFKGWFREIVFAVYVTHGNPNFDIFTEIFKDVEV